MLVSARGFRWMPVLAVLLVGWTIVLADDVRLKSADGEPLSEDEQAVVDSSLDVDVLQPGTYHLDVDVDAGTVRIVEADPAVEPADSAH